MLWVVSFSSSSRFGPRRDAISQKRSETAQNRRKDHPDAIDAMPQHATRRAGNVYGPPLGTHLVVFWGVVVRLLPSRRLARAEGADGVDDGVEVERGQVGVLVLDEAAPGC